MASRKAWTVREAPFDPEKQRQMETIFTVGNGYLGTRGTLEERYPGDLPATLISGLYDNTPLVHTELVNVPNWTSCQLVVEGERFALERGEVLACERELDLREGILRRCVRWRSPKGHTAELLIERWASMAEPH
ncbi:MAG TPA: beta-phosphoglucomutase, partial [Candidatus Acetothermia bacterium]|nr:beta-phosphoglucomutase [Candidatus Acetothermia bacterium]